MAHLVLSIVLPIMLQCPPQIRQGRPPSSEENIRHILLWQGQAVYEHKAYSHDRVNAGGNHRTLTMRPNSSSRICRASLNLYDEQEMLIGLWGSHCPLPQPHQRE